MQPIEILPDFFFIERGFLNGNHFAYRSDKSVLIDTAYSADADVTLQTLTELGIEIDKTASIINTHCHCDHIGANKIIQDRSDCEIAIHRFGKHFIDTKNDWATWWRYFSQEADFFRCTRALEDGETVLVGPHRFQVIHTPGHAVEGIVLYNEKDKILISSDTLWEKDLPVMNVRVEGSACVLYSLDSLEKIAALDAQTVFPGHGKPFTDFKGALKRSETRLKKYLADPEQIGTDVLKKIIVYTLLMHKSIPESRFLPLLMETSWYRETVDLYFKGRYQKKFDEVTRDLEGKKAVGRNNGNWITGVKP